MNRVKNTRTAFVYSTCVHAVTLLLTVGSLKFPRGISSDVVVGFGIANTIFAAYWLVTALRSKRSPVRGVQVTEAFLRIMASLAVIEYYKRGRTRFRVSRKSTEHAVLAFTVLTVPLSIYVYTRFERTAPPKPTELTKPAERPIQEAKRVHFTPVRMPKSPVATLFPGINVSSWKSAFSDTFEIEEPAVSAPQLDHFNGIIHALHDPNVCQSCKLTRVTSFR